MTAMASGSRQISDCAADTAVSANRRLITDKQSCCGRRRRRATLSENRLSDGRTTRTSSQSLLQLAAA